MQQHKSQKAESQWIKNREYNKSIKINTKIQSQISINCFAGKGISHTHIWYFYSAIQYLVNCREKERQVTERTEMRMTEWDTLRNWGEGLRLKQWRPGQWAMGGCSITTRRLFLRQRHNIVGGTNWEGKKLRQRHDKMD